MLGGCGRVWEGVGGCEGVISDVPDQAGVGRVWAELGEVEGVRV